MKKKSKWTVKYGGIEDGSQFEPAGIITPQGKSIFGIDFSEFMGMSNRMAEKIVKLLNEAGSR